jgi:hypothetical protein
LLRPHSGYPAEPAIESTARYLKLSAKAPHLSSMLSFIVRIKRHWRASAVVVIFGSLFATVQQHRRCALAVWLRLIVDASGHRLPPITVWKLSEDHHAGEIH